MSAMKFYLCLSVLKRIILQWTEHEIYPYLHSTALCPQVVRNDGTFYHSLP